MCRIIEKYQPWGTGRFPFLPPHTTLWTIKTTRMQWFYWVSKFRREKFELGMIGNTYTGLFVIRPVSTWMLV